MRAGDAFGGVQPPNPLRAPESRTPASLIAGLQGASAALQYKCSLCGRTFESHGSASRVYCKQCIARADRAIAAKMHADCKECGKRFVMARRNSRYCSMECRTRVQQRYNREYQRKAMADPERRAIILARTRASAAASAARKGGGSTGKPRKQAHPRASHSAEPSVCGLCGRDFLPYNRARHAYCKRCAAKADREIVRKMRVKCKECGKSFSTTNHNVRYCSKACSAAGKRRSRRESRHRRMADPEKRAAESAYVRAWYAARKPKQGDAGRSA